jgi:carbon-monoxide dehydrogenase large subunit
MTAIGIRLPRKEDPRLLRGRGRFGDDVTAEGQLWARIVRSPVAHGHIRSIDTADASRAKDIVTVITAEDLPELHRIPVRLTVDGPDLTGYLQPVLAAGTVRYVGEPLAVVVGADPYACEDAADDIGIDIDDLPPVLDATDAGTAAAELTRAYGDVDSAFRDAAHVTAIQIEIGRHSGVPLEPRCLLAVPDGAGLDIYGMTKVPVYNRDLLARMLGIDQNRIHVHSVDAGGGFGIRGEFYPEDFLIPWLASTLNRPVKWTEDRAEHLVAANHSRQQQHQIAVAFDRDGRITALTDDVVHDNGAYCRTHGISVAELTIAMLPGPYRVPAYRGRVTISLTSKTPCGTYRAPGRFEGTTAREHLLDVAADELGIDRVELRRRNLLTAADMPHRRPISTLGTDLVLDAGDYPALLAAATSEADRLGYRIKPGQASTKRHGFGLAMFVEKSGLGPHETADVTVTETGAVTVRAGGTSFGQGIETVLAQIAADTLGVAPDTVTVIAGDTGEQPFGTGSWASRSTVVGGSAVHQAALAVREEALKLAADLLEAAQHDLDVAGGTIRVRGDPGASVTLAEIARTTPLTARRRFEVDHMTYPYGVHAATVEVDRDTGQVRVLRYLVAYEVGRAINPMLVEGQLRGGVAQGIGGALLEEFGYDDQGQPQSVSFLDYRMPTAAEIPDIDILLQQQNPSPGNPLGVMGAGEGGVNAAGAAIANAVRDALGVQGGLRRLPLTPAQVAAVADTDKATRP